MIPTSSRIPSRENRIALATSQANPRSRTQLESEPIAQPQAGLFLPMFAVLSGDEAADVLTFGKTIAQAAYVGASRQSSNLIDLGKILSAHCKAQTAGEFADERKSQFCRSRRNPIGFAVGKARARPG